MTRGPYGLSDLIVLGFWALLIGGAILGAAITGLVVWVLR